MNELVIPFGYDRYYIKVNIGDSIGISITPIGHNRPSSCIWFYPLTLYKI